MKLLLALCLAICIVGAHCKTSVIDGPADRIKICAQKNNLSQATVDEIKTSYNFSANKDTKCFALCLSQGSGLVDADAKVTDKFRGDPDVEDCKKKISATDKCEIAAQLANCLVAKDD